MRAKEGETVFSLRLPNDLLAKVEARAKLNRRSINAEMLIMLERFVELREKLDAPPGGDYPVGDASK
jgi:hypothetical protein